MLRLLLLLQRQLFATNVQQIQQKESTPVLVVSPTGLRPVASFQRHASSLRLTTLVELAAVDRPDCSGRFTMHYLFLAPLLRHRCTLRLLTTETEAVPTLAAVGGRDRRLFASAGGLEREVGDLFGIYFAGHDDLRRILTDYGFTGHPLRKDFPLTGFSEVSYNQDGGRLAYEAVELAQEYRAFQLMTASPRILGGGCFLHQHPVGLFAFQPFLYFF